MKNLMNTAEIKAIRKALKLNTKDFGDLFPVSPRTVEHWESGYRNPSRMALKRLASLRN